MSLEHALLDRLEKRSLQIAQQKNESYGLRQLVNEKMSINEQLAEQITTARLEREQMQHQISELRTERDRIREISKSLVPKSALMQAVQEAAELERQANGLSAEMNSLANQLMDAKAEASGIRGLASSWGCKEGETVTAFIQRLSMELAEAKTDLADTIAKTTDLGSYAMTLGRKEGEPLEMFMERQALRLAALETTIAAAKCDELAKATARIKPLEALYKTLKGWQENDHIIGYGLTIDTAINKATEALSQLTA